MAIQIGAKPDSGFDDPLGMLKDCHRRIENFLGILCVVVERAQGRNLTGEERDTVQAALQYFRSGMPTEQWLQEPLRSGISDAS